jgi:hypothetical protein
MQTTIMRELAHAPQSGAWLITLPSQRAYRLLNDQYLLAVRKRLGMLPDSSLLVDSCLACHGRNLELPQFKLDPHHSEACVHHTGADVTDRHNGLVRVLGELARWAPMCALISHRWERHLYLSSILSPAKEPTSCSAATSAAICS